MELAEFCRDLGHNPEQVQDFYPTPSTLATVMYCTGLDPRTMEPVYVPRSPHEKALQRALIQYRDPRNRALVEEALRKAGREDLIGYGPKCLVRPGSRSGGDTGKKPSGKPRRSAGKPRRAAGKRPAGQCERPSEGPQAAASRAASPAAKGGAEGRRPAGTGPKARQPRGQRDGRPGPGRPPGPGRGGRSPKQR